MTDLETRLAPPPPLPDAAQWGQAGRVSEIEIGTDLLEAVVRAVPVVAFVAVVLHTREPEPELSWAILRGEPIKGTALRALTAELQAAAPHVGEAVAPAVTQVLASRLALETLAVFPLDAPSRRLGFLLVGRDPIGVFTTDDDAALHALCRHATLVLENMVLRRDVASAARQRREVEALFGIVREITSRLELDAVLTSVVRHARDLVGTKIAYLALLDDDKGDFYVRATIGERSGQLAAMRLSLQDGLGAIAAREHAPVAVPDIVNDPRRSVKWGEVCAAEGIRAVLVAPLHVETRLVGMLFVANRHVTEFTPDDAAALAGLAAIAGIAIENARLYEREREAAVQLQRLNQAHAAQYASAQRRAALYDALVEAAVSSDGVQAIAATLAQILQSPVLVEDRHFQLLACATPSGQSVAEVTSHGSTAAALRDARLDDAVRWMRELRKPVRLSARPHVGLATPRVIAPIIVEGVPAGYLSVVETGRKLEQPELATIEQALSVFALELRRRQDVADAEGRFAGELLHDLLDGTRPAESSERARRLGYDPAAEYLVTVIAIEQAAADGPAGAADESASVLSERMLPVVRDVFRAHAPSGALPLVAARDDVLVALVPAKGDADFVEHLHRELVTLLAGMTVTIAASEPTLNLASVAKAYRSAIRTWRAGLRRSGRGKVVHRADVGIYRLLVEMATRDDLLAFARDVLGPLANADNRRTQDLLRTLDAYLECACHPHATAKALFVHPHTLRYRLARIEEVLGHPIDDPAWRRDAQMALVILHLEEPALFA